MAGSVLQDAPNPVGLGDPRVEVPPFPIFWLFSCRHFVALLQNQGGSQPPGSGQPGGRCGHHACPHAAAGREPGGGIPVPKHWTPWEGTHKQPDPCELLAPMKTYEQANKPLFLQHSGVPQSVLGHTADPQTPFLTCQLPFASAVVLGQPLGTSGTRSGVLPRHRASVLVLVTSCFPSEHPKRGAGRGAAMHPAEPPSLALNSSPTPAFIWAARRIARASPQVYSRCQISLTPDLPPSDKLRAGCDGEGAPRYLNAAAVRCPLSSPAERYAAKSTALGDLNELVRRAVETSGLPKLNLRSPALSPARLPSAMPGEGRGAPNPCPPLRRLHLPCDPLAAANHLMGLAPKLIVSQPFPLPGQAVSAAAPRGAPRAPRMPWEGLSVPGDGVDGWEPGRSWAKLLEKLGGGSSHLPRVGFLQP